MWFESKKEKKRRRRMLLIGAFLFISIFVAFYLTLVYGGWDQCREANSIKELEFKGVVIKKTLNKEDKYQQKIKISFSEETITLDLSNEILKLRETGNSFTWEKLSVHDSIKKEKGTFEIRYKEKESNSWKKIEMAFPDCENIEETVANSK